MKAISAGLAASLIASVIMGAAPAAFASSATDFSVTGRITPGACYPTLSNNTVDFGDISVTQLQRHTATQIDTERFTTLNISCDAATRYGIRAVDDRAASVGNHWFKWANGLGLTPKGEKIGAHYVEVLPTRSSIDGEATFLTRSDTRGQSWDYSSADPSTIPNDRSLLGLSDLPRDATGPVAVREASLALKHFMVVAPAEGLTLTGEVMLDGQVTLELVYL